MGRIGIKHTVVCVECGARDELSKTEAKVARWFLWLGGGRCPKCCADRERKPTSTAPFDLPTFREHVVVACSSCEREFDASNEYTDGWHPGIHWTKEPELVQRTKDSIAARTRNPKVSIVPLPLCPGWNKAGRVVRVERREIAR